MNDIIFIEYPTCSTCRKAKKFLEANKVEFKDRHIVEDTPCIDELKQWTIQGDVAIDSLFNTSGLVYRELGLKDKLKTLTDDEKYALLASNGMLIKRPLLIYGTTLLVGFKEDIWLKTIDK